jgi:diaminopimelate epimerase
MRVWERGAGETLACGTGASAALVAAVLNGLSPRKATIHLRGGDLKASWHEDDHVFIEGPAAEVCTGETSLDEDL